MELARLRFPLLWRFSCKNRDAECEQRAKALLESSDWPLARIAERSGFASLDTLHRAFLKHLAVTPGFYRAHFGAGV